MFSSFIVTWWKKNRWKHDHRKWSFLQACGQRCGCPMATLNSRIFHYLAWKLASFPSYASLYFWKKYSVIPKVYMYDSRAKILLIHSPSQLLLVYFLTFNAPHLSPHLYPRVRCVAMTSVTLKWKPKAKLMKWFEKNSFPFFIANIFLWSFEENQSQWTNE